MLNIAMGINGILDHSNNTEIATTDTTDSTKSCYTVDGNYLSVIPGRGLWNNWSWDVGSIRIPSLTLIHTINLLHVYSTINTNIFTFNVENGIHYIIVCAGDPSHTIDVGLQGGICIYQCTNHPDDANYMTFLYVQATAAQITVQSGDTPSTWIVVRVHLR